MKDKVEIQGKIYDSANLIKKRFGIANMTLLRWTKAGLLPPPMKVGNRTYYEHDLVDTYVTSGGCDEAVTE